MSKTKNITWDDLPINIQKVMIKYHKDTRNLKNLDIESAIYSYKYNILGGFFWDSSPEGGNFWREILLNNNIIYFKQYYKNNITQYLIDYGYF